MPIRRGWRPSGGMPTSAGKRRCGSAEGGEILTVRSTHEQAVTSAKAWRGTEPLPHIRFKNF